LKGSYYDIGKQERLRIYLIIRFNW